MTERVGVLGPNPFSALEDSAFERDFSQLTRINPPINYL